MLVIACSFVLLLLPKFPANLFPPASFPALSIEEAIICSFALLPLLLDFGDYRVASPVVQSIVPPSMGNTADLTEVMNTNTFCRKMYSTFVCFGCLVVKVGSGSMSLGVRYCFLSPRLHSFIHCVPIADAF